MSAPAFDTVLVANRGEIAVRVMRACRELGIGTVAVYSDADADAEHVRYADEAYNVGPARAADSYLDGDAILEVADRADADAIHPGYGFLAENAEFAASVEAREGLTWIGPSSDAMRSLGEKTTARRVMAEQDVPIVPGKTEPVSDVGEVEDFAAEHGYPVAIKAEGGGGGRGMKILQESDDAGDLLESARREGAAYFDNDSVYLERYLENPRHVEVQILADEDGTVCHLGERDCSLQRRHQKLIEEGPSPALSDGLRDRICEAARRGIRDTEYVNAGTVEFLVEEDPERDGAEVLGPETAFYFLEVNTRIQVEHTVTEAITGIDIVKEQLRIAAGEPLSFTQEELDSRGHAMEFRVNAENAAREFRPARGGTLQRYSPPEGAGIRVDDAVREGETLVTDYDSMIAKLVVWGRDRTECLDRADRALAEYDVAGVDTILPFHRLMVEDEAFITGTHTTKYVDKHLDQTRLETAQERWGASSPDSDGSELVQRDFIIELDGQRRDLTIYGTPAELAPFGAEDDVASPADGSATGTRSDSSTDSAANPGRTKSGTAASPSDTTDGDAGTDTDDTSSVQTSGEEDDSDVDTGGADAVKADMQGTILSVTVAPGDEVDPGDVLCVLEAMKMENDIVASRSGTVETVHVEAGDTVEIDQPLVTFE